jgi:23S rRNA pseudouridine1911/1915/1917 synthase
MIREFTVEHPNRLDKALAEWMPEHSRSKLAKLITDGEVKVNGVAAKPGTLLRTGDRVSVVGEPESVAHDLTPADIPLDIRYEDAHLLVINKPRGLAVHPASTLKEPSLVNALLARSHSLSSAGGSFRPGIVHRLDKATTGLLVVAKSDQVHVSLAKQVAGKTAERRYLAVVAGKIDQERFTVDAPIGRSKANRILMAVDPSGKRAITHVKRVQDSQAGTVIACRLETGRTHQIRVHLSAVGHPIIGDPLYAPKLLQTAALQLHSAMLAFKHPISGEMVECYAEPPSDFLSSGALEGTLIGEF